VNATTIIARQTQGPLANPLLETLAVAHYEQVYTLCHAFHGDPSACLSLTNQIFRDASGEPTLMTVCANAVRALTRRPGDLPAPGHSLCDNLAWLLKEAMALRYADIGALLGLDANQVRHAIASVRETLLSAVGEQVAA
jgi:hypothetical protein